MNTDPKSTHENAAPDAHVDRHATADCADLAVVPTLLASRGVLAADGCREVGTIRASPGARRAGLAVGSGLVLCRVG
jgi:hypothetical protein